MNPLAVTGAAVVVFPNWQIDRAARSSEQDEGRRRCETTPTA
ncbi:MULTISPECIES: hypothetical protein [unclassified Curtobacterium]|nr:MULTISPECIES: hypothetical protein [unclassified Curtobacterium]